MQTTFLSQFKIPKVSFSKATLNRGLKGFLITFISFGIFSEYVHFIKSPTDSLPEHYFIQFPKITPKKGDLTVVYNGWYQGKIIKRIIGVAGDQITTDSEGNIFINQQKVGKAKEFTDLERGLTLTAIKPQIIPEGRVFLHSSHPQSFDSRYQEVGLVDVEDLEGLVIAIV